MDESIPFASRDYFIFAAILAFARGMDFLSTWVATPRLVLEGNPIAKWLGWKWGAVVNLILITSLAMWPLSAVIISTASVLVAARNFQSAWLMRSLGEDQYRRWHGQRIAETPIQLYLFCFAGSTLLPLGVGIVLVIFSHAAGYVLIIPLGIGMGIIAYSVAVIVFTLLALWRGRLRALAASHSANLENP